MMKPEVSPDKLNPRWQISLDLLTSGLRVNLSAYPDIHSATVLSTGRYRESDNHTVSFLPLYWAYQVGSQ
jgi:hypothetical protein